VAVAAVAAALAAAVQRSAAERSVAVGSAAVCVLAPGGAVSCYGSNATAAVAAAPPSGVSFHAVTAGEGFACGLARNGSMLCWGNMPGGNPLPVPGLTYIDVHAGPAHVCGLRASGELRCFGACAHSECDAPGGGAVAFQGMAAGTNYSCGVTRNHSVVCWGDPTHPVVVGAPVNVGDAEHVAAGATHACYIRINGSVACWGDNAVGQAAVPPALVAANVSAGTGAWWLTCGAGTSCALAGGPPPARLTCWGAFSSVPPIAVPNGQAAYEVACSGWGCAAVVELWGGGSSTARRVAAWPSTLPGAAAAAAPVLATLVRPPNVTTPVASSAQMTFICTGIARGTVDTFVFTAGNEIVGASPGVNGTAWVVRDIAGAGVYGTTDSPVGANARFNNPYGLGLDTAGNILVADSLNHRIRRVSPSGGVTTLAGAIAGFKNDVGTNASFNQPYDVKEHAKTGTLYVADKGNTAIRVITSGPVWNVTTLVTVANPNALAIDDVSDFLYAACSSPGRVVRITFTGVVTVIAGGTSGYADGMGSNAKFAGVFGVVLHTSGNLYVADTDNNAIRMVSPNGTVTTVTRKHTGGEAMADGVGTGAVLVRPWGLAMDATGTVYVADSGSFAIRRLEPQLGATIARAPPPPAPLTLGDQLMPWRALAAGSDGDASDALGTVDVQAAVFDTPLVATATAGLNPTVTTLLLPTVTLVAQQATAPADTAPGDATFASSVRRSLRTLALATPSLPAYALSLPALTELQLTAPPGGSGGLALGAGSFAGLPALTCINCRGVAGVANLSHLGITRAAAYSQQLPVFSLPGITVLDLANNSLGAVLAHDFDDAGALLQVNLNGNALRYVSPAAFSDARHPALAAVNMTGNPITASGCWLWQRATYMRLATGALVFTCHDCIAGVNCPPLAPPSEPAVLLPPLAQGPPPGGAAALMTVTVRGTALCVRDTPDVIVMTVGGVPCCGATCVRDADGVGGAAVCSGWNVTAAAAAAAPAIAAAAASNTTLWLDVTAVLANHIPARCDGCVEAVLRPSLTHILPAAIAAPGVWVVVAGTGITDASGTPPTVLIGGSECGTPTVVAPGLVKCRAPTLLASVPGFPVVGVQVVNAAGAATSEPVYLTYPATFSVSWAEASRGSVTVLPGGPAVQPAPILSVSSRAGATCTVALNTATPCAASGASALARPAAMALVGGTTVDVPGNGTGNATHTTTAAVAGLLVTGPSHCAAALVATCVDAISGSTADTVGQPGPQLVLPDWALAWDAAIGSMPSPLVVAPAPLPPLNATFLFIPPGTPAAAATAATAALSCTAVLVRAPATPPATPLADLRPADVVSTAVGAVAVAGGAGNGVSVSFSALSAAGAGFGAALAMWAECTWVPTGERVRLPVLAVATLQLSLAWSWAPPASAPAYVLGYTPFNLTVSVHLTRGASGGGGGDSSVPAACTLSIANATAQGAALAAAPWEVALLPTAPDGTVWGTARTVLVRASARSWVAVVAECGAWGHNGATPPLPLPVASLAVTLLTPPPPSFISSDASSPWPVTPALAVRLASVEGNVSISDATCSLATTTLGATLAATAAGASLSSITVDAAGVARVPVFIVQAAAGAAAVTLSMTCRRTSSGDSPPPAIVTVPAVRLTAQLCNVPATSSPVSTALAPFTVGIATAIGADVTYPCDASPTTPTTLPTLPAIVCVIGLNASASTSNDTSSVFLQHTTAAVAAASHVATFDRFMLLAPQRETYGLVVTCSVGGAVVNPPLPFAVTVLGCPAGQEEVLVKCVTCGGGAFSLGGATAHCTTCPAAGAACEAGIITLLPHYYRPPSQAGQPLGPDTELHSCYSAEACTLDFNGTEAAYGCTYGYAGPLCGVCDADVNYARFGESCGPCWDTRLSGFFMAVLIVAVLAVLAAVALRAGAGRSDATIVLRITLSYLQAVGSIRTFKAGSTRVYASVMGWTEVVSASPLSVGALQCLLRMPYLVQYAATVSLPVTAAATVMAIFFLATAARSVRCGGCVAGCRYDARAARAAVVAWVGSKRHLSTLLFVLFLVYMPITSASLRALDCIPPVAGVRYLRSDLSVECGVGQQAAAAAIAYTILLAVCLGFPAGLAWLLGTASEAQLVDPAFHATWGFLFDGYRAPTLTLVDAAAEEPGEVPPSALPSAATPPSAGDGALPGGGGDGGEGGRRRASMLQLQARLKQRGGGAGGSRGGWEGGGRLRKGGIGLVAVRGAPPHLQCVGASLWLLGAIGLQLRYAPYAKRKFNRMELAALTATFATTVISTALLQFNVDAAAADAHDASNMHPIEWVVTVALAVLNLGMFATLAYLWLRLQCRCVRRAVATHLPALRAPRTTTTPVPAPAPVVNPLLRVGAADGAEGGVRRAKAQTAALANHIYKAAPRRGRAPLPSVAEAARGAAAAEVPTAAVEVAAKVAGGEPCNDDAPLPIKVSPAAL